MTRFFLSLTLLLSLITTAWAKERTLKPVGLEKEVLDAVDSKKWATARELAQKLLDRVPDDFFGRYAMAMVYYHGDGDLPHALAIVRSLLDWIEINYSTSRDYWKLKLVGVPFLSDKSASEWYRKLLWLKAILENAMDKNQEYLQTIEDLSFLYPNSVSPVYKVWPLIKLNRFSEAISIAKSFIDSHDYTTRIKAYNGLVVAYSEMGLVEDAIQWGLRGESVLDPESEVIYCNIAGNAIAAMMYEKVPEYVDMAVNAPNQDCPSSPYKHLFMLYLIEGKFTLAVSAFKEIMEEGLTPEFKVQEEPLYRRMVAQLFLLLGSWKLALQRMRLVYNAPSRLGYTSSRQWMDVIQTDTIYWSAINSAIEGKLEEWAAEGLTSGVFRRLKELGELELLKWRLKREVAKALSKKKHIDLFFSRVGPSMTSFFAGELVRILGPGIALEIARQKAERVPQRFRWNYDIMEAEALYWKGEMEEAIRALQHALKTTPREEVLARYRLKALLSRAASRLGYEDVAFKYQVDVLTHLGSIFRILGLKVPVSIEPAGEGHSKTIADRLSRSPRFLVEDDAPLIVRIQGSDASDLSVCLLTREGTVIRCAYPKSKWKGRDVVSRLIKEFHALVFAPPIDMTQVELNSLDGSLMESTAQDLLKTLRKTP